MNNNYHESVMTNEVVDNLHVKKALYIDATVGTAGHTLEIVKNGGMVLGIEADPEMLAIAKKRVKKAKFVLGNFIDIEKIAKENNFSNVSGILFDLGVSNLHLKNLERGFSFENPDADLDMRLNPKEQGVKAADLLNLLRSDQLVELFKTVVDLSGSRWLTSNVIKFRNIHPIEKVGDFLEICHGLKTGKKTLHEATLPFLALRIAVNSELDNLRVVLPKAYELLEKGGRLVVITFHSGEDEIVKKFFGQRGELVLPTNDEINNNQRARSAKMRILTKI